MPPIVIIDAETSILARKDITYEGVVNTGWMWCHVGLFLLITGFNVKCGKFAQQENNVKTTIMYLTESETIPMIDYDFDTNEL